MSRLLLVDDDHLLRSAIRAWLEADGHEVITADCGASGMTALRQDAIDLVIVDIFMPHMQGFDSVRTFHQCAPTTPLIAISGYVFAENRIPAPDFLRMALELGATRCLRKPFTSEALLGVVSAVLAERDAKAATLTTAEAKRADIHGGSS
ncbi:response regulator [Rhodopseudomonas sp. B29]|uniref:response regulator n=1 Tax=Rhodopseudomonas sp. B29 TaxID=95607 RepID=UPI0003B7874B|nr:response regulator [Rhodopseudomonas sp. B29]